jgi:hypothetical protein
MKRKHIGSSFDSFLKEEGIYDECQERAKKNIKRRENIETIRIFCLGFASGIVLFGVIIIIDTLIRSY